MDNTVKPVANPLAGGLSRPLPQPRTISEPQLLTLLVVAVAGLFFVINHNVSYTAHATLDYAPSSVDSAAAVAEGSTMRKVGYLLMGGIGLLLLTRRYGRRFTFRDPLALAMLAYWTLCTASVVWSIDPGLTLRRVIVLGCSMLIVFGVVRQLHRRQLLQLAFFTSLAIVLGGLASELATGAFRPWSSGYRYAGTVHPNSQGQLCALLCLSAYAWFRQVGKGRWLLLGVMAFSLALMLLTKSRTSCLAVSIGMLTMWLPHARRERVAFAALSLPFLLCSAAFAAAILGFDVADGAGSAVALGRGGQVGSLTGRVPLWLEVAPHVLERPILGHGYLSFWTPWRIQHTSELFEWTIPDAHNEYLETLLNVGLLGGMLLAIVVLGSAIRCLRAYWRTGDPTVGFFAAQILIAMVSGLFESGFAQPLGLVSFVTTCGAAWVACRLPVGPHDANEASRS